MTPFDEWLRANGDLFPTPMEYPEAVEAARAAFKAGVALGVRGCWPSMPIQADTTAMKAELETALASAKSGPWVALPNAVTFASDPIPCVGYVTGLDASGKPIIHYTDPRFDPATERRESVADGPGGVAPDLPPDDWRSWPIAETRRRASVALFAVIDDAAGDDPDTLFPGTAHLPGGRKVSVTVGPGCRIKNTSGGIIPAGSLIALDAPPDDPAVVEG